MERIFALLQMTALAECCHTAACDVSRLPRDGNFLLCSARKLLFNCFLQANEVEVRVEKVSFRKNLSLLT